MSLDSCNINLIEFINTIFSKPASKPCSFIINSRLTLNEYEKNRHIMLPILMNILILGAKKLFGENITPKNMTPSQFEILQNYFKSFGFIIKYDFIIENDIPAKVDIWFEKYKPIQTCNGLIIY